MTLGVAYGSLERAKGEDLNVPRIAWEDLGCGPVDCRQGVGQSLSATQQPIEHGGDGA